MTQVYIAACGIVESSATTSQARQGCFTVVVCTCRRTEMVPVVTHLCFCIHLHASSTTASRVKDGCKHTTRDRLPECLKAGMGSKKDSLVWVKCIKKSQQATREYCIRLSVLQQIERRLSWRMCKSSTLMCKQRSPHLSLSI